MAELTAGMVFAGHRIDALAGRGGMGVVYRATQLALDRTVALKVIAPDLMEDRSARQRFLRESKLAASIDHPHVIPVYYTGEEDGVAYIAMRFVRGDDLRSLVRKNGPLDARHAARIVGQVASALDAAHASSLVHRDVKPANVLLGQGEHVYLSDFGLSKRALSAAGETRSGQWVGSLDYVAPEQIRGERVDARADVYALGCVLYFALTGRPPYPREGDEAKLWAHLRAPPPRPSDSVTGLPPDIDDVVVRALAKEPADRYPSAGDLGRAAVAAAEHSKVSEHERAVGVGAAAPDESPTESGPRPATWSPGSEDETVVEPSTRRPRAVWAAAGVAGLAVAAVVVAVSLGGGGTPEATPTPSPTRPSKATAAAFRPKVVGTVRVGGRPNSIAVGKGTVFVTNFFSKRVTLIDEAKVKERRSRPTVGVGGDGVAGGPSGIWVVVNREKAVFALDPVSGRERARIALPLRPRQVAVGHGAVWVGMVAEVSGSPAVLARIDPDTRKITGTFPVPKGIQALLATPAGIWVVNRLDPVVSRFDPRTERFTRRVPIGVTRLGGAAYGAGAVWVTSPQEDTVSKIDDRTGRKVSTGAGRRPTGIAARGSQIWVTNLIDHTITHIDPETGRPEGHPVAVPLNPYAITITGDSAWLTAIGRGDVARVRYRARH